MNKLITGGTMIFFLIGILIMEEMPASGTLLIVLSTVLLMFSIRKIPEDKKNGK